MFKTDDLLRDLAANPRYRELIADKKGMFGVWGLNGGAYALFAALIAGEAGGRCLLVVPDMDRAARLAESLRAFSLEGELFYPSGRIAFEAGAEEDSAVRSRAGVLSALLKKERALVITSAAALSGRYVPPAAFSRFNIVIRSGGAYDPLKIAGELVQMGYAHQKAVDRPGSFSRRGSVMDVFSPGDLNPVRLSFFDDELESISRFDIDTQRSIERIDGAEFCPATLTPAAAPLWEAAKTRLEADLVRTGAVLASAAGRKLNDKYAPLLLKNSPGSDMPLDYLYPDAPSLLSYFEGGTAVFIGADLIKKHFLDQAKSRTERFGELLAAGRVLPRAAHGFLSYEQIEQEFKSLKTVFLTELPFGDMPGAVSFPSSAPPDYFQNPRLLSEDTDGFRRQGYRVIFTAGSELRLKRAREILRQFGIDFGEEALSPLNRGFISRELKIALITEKELLGQEKRKAVRTAARRGKAIDNFSELRAGDYVVHLYHGVGRYMGIQRLPMGDITRDYLYLQYQGEDKLFLPIDQMEMIHKYIGGEEAPPKIYKLGGGQWQKVKNRVRGAVENIARELLELYAAREATGGFAFSADGEWQKEFEDAFIYEETPDQLNAAEEIKRDMERPVPMDRVLCGDVGYGKTEVAMRAVFKAVTDGKQSVVVVPTTVLAQQHYHTFSERFRGFPVKVGLLSRFVPRKEQIRVLDDLKSGVLDVLIATHRVFSKDVRYHDLGLLVVDEEQRFGVADKEKIKRMRSNIDVLMLSATPIPRTLHMSLVGMRDMSVIVTPPEQRMAIKTYVLEYDEHLLKEAVRAELARGGQVYFLHNRIADIDLAADAISRLAPEARIRTAHGRMTEGELDRVMTDFIEGGFDILVCTSIIESGLDIPNVNTLFVDEADSLGLSQLYQLRGRVGRADRQAYAYFTYRKQKILSDAAKKRLTAIRDFTDLGSGFKIAMRDMEIRGAGNILGAEQHGNIVAVGFDLYCRLVAEEIERQKGMPVPENAEPVLLEMGVNAFIPDSYVDDTTLKLDIYQRIATAPDEGYIDALEAELADRYGPLPSAARGLLALGRIKVLAQDAKIISVVLSGDTVRFSFSEKHGISGDCLVALSARYQKNMRVLLKEGFAIKLKLSDKTETAILGETHGFLSSLAELNR